MPLVPTTLDNGFTSLLLPHGTAFDPPKPDDPSWIDTAGEFASGVGAMLMPQAFSTPTRGSDQPSPLQRMAGAAVPTARLSNPTWNAIEYFMRPKFTRDLNFNPAEQLKNDGLLEYRDRFTEVWSQAEYDWTKARIAEELRMKQELARAGGAGLAMSFVLGLADPTSALPFVAEGRGPLVFLKSALLGSAAGAIAEAPIQLNQVTADPWDMGWSIGGGAVMGGIFGGSAAYFAGRHAHTIDALLEAAAKSMGDEPGNTAIPAIRSRDVIEAELRAANDEYNAIPESRADIQEMLDNLDMERSGFQNFIISARENNIFTSGPWGNMPPEPANPNKWVPKTIEDARNVTNPRIAEMEATAKALEEANLELANNEAKRRQRETGEYTVGDDFYFNNMAKNAYKAAKLRAEAAVAKLTEVLPKGYAAVAINDGLHYPGKGYIKPGSEFDDGQGFVIKILKYYPEGQVSGGEKVPPDLKALGDAIDSEAFADWVWISNVDKYLYANEGNPIHQLLKTGSVRGGMADVFSSVESVMLGDSAVPDRMTERRLLEQALADPARLDNSPRRTELKAKIESLLDELNHAEKRDERISAEAEVDELLSGKRDLNAAELERDPGVLKGMLGVGEKLTRLAGPVTAVLGQRVSKRARWVMAQLGDAGLVMSNNVIMDKNGKVLAAVPSNYRGTVEAVVRQRYSEVVEALTFARKQHADYIFGEGQGPKVGRQTAAALTGLKNQMPLIGNRNGIGPQAKLTLHEFFKAVGEAMQNGDTHGVPQVEATAKEFRKLYDKIHDEAVKAGVLSGNEELIGDVSYLNRMYDTHAIRGDINTFKGILVDHFKSLMQDRFVRRYEGFRSAQDRDAARVRFMDMPEAEAAKLRDDLNKQLAALDNIDDEDVLLTEAMITEARSRALGLSQDINRIDRQLGKSGISKSMRQTMEAERARLVNEREQARAEVAAHEESLGPDGAARKEQRKQIKAQLRMLNKNRFYFAEKERAAYDAIESLEDAALESLHRAGRSVHKVIVGRERADASVAKDIARAKQLFESAYGKFKALQEKVDNLRNRAETGAGQAPNKGEPLMWRLFAAEDKYNTSLDRLSKARENLEIATDPDMVEGLLNDQYNALKEVQDAVLEKVNELNFRRAQRAAKLKETAAKFDTVAFQKLRDATLLRMKEREQKLYDILHEEGYEGFDLTKGTSGDITSRAKELTDIATNKILGTNIRLPGFDALGDKRGAELIRTLSVPSERLTPYGFIDTDAQRALQAYHNTLVPDIELYNRIGPLAEDVGRAGSGELNREFAAINAEEAALLEAYDRGVKARGEDIKSPKHQDAKRAIQKEYTSIRENLRAVIQRIRHQWGLPDDPHGLSARMANVLTLWTGMRFLGMVAISGMTDFAKPVARYGLLRTLRAAWLPLVTNISTVKLTYEQAKHALVGVEVMLADRSHAMMDLLMDASQHGTKAERALKYASSKIGLITGFAHQTDFAKILSTMAAMSKIGDSLDIVAGVSSRNTEIAGIMRQLENPALTKAERAELEASIKQLEKQTDNKAHAKAAEFLASLGWDEGIQKRIMKQLQGEAGHKSNVPGLGATTVIPIFDKFTDEGAAKALKAAIWREASAAIVTPGVEVPKMMNATPWARVLFGLKSYIMASTSKTLMAGLQQRDMAVVNGFALMVALGFISLYAKATIAGPEALAQFQSWSPNEKVNRAVDASGILGVLGWAAQTTADVTAGMAGGDSQASQGLAAVRNALGMHSFANPESSIIEDFLGPSFDFGATVAQTLATGDWTPAQVHRIRSLLPLQNVFYLRWLFDRLENSVGGDR